MGENDNKGLVHGHAEYEREQLIRRTVGDVVLSYFDFELSQQFPDQDPTPDETRAFFTRRAPVYIDALNRGETIVLDKLEDEGISIDVLSRQRVVQRGSKLDFTGVKSYQLNRAVEEWRLEDGRPVDAFTESINWTIRPNSDDPFVIRDFALTISQGFGSRIL